MTLLEHRWAHGKYDIRGSCYFSSAAYIDSKLAIPYTTHTLRIWLELSHSISVPDATTKHTYPGHHGLRIVSDMQFLKG